MYLHFVVCYCIIQKINIYEYGNIRHCPTKQTSLMNIVLFLDKINKISHFTTSAQYTITYAEMHTYLRRRVKLQNVCSLYAPTHHMNCLQLLTLKPNIN